ncbi:MAG: LysR family transcriptional regulator [Acidobacteriota bacterium]
MKAEVELRHLRVFTAVVDAGTYTRAARSLGVSQSTVSETLGALERTLGVALFRKARRGQVLTASGEILLAYARRMFALTSELAGALSGASSQVQATLTVSAVESVGAYVLPSRLAALRERWPSVRVEVLTGSCPEIRDRVACGECDLGLVLEPEDLPEPGAVLAKARLLILCAPAHPLAGRGASAEQLRVCEFSMCDAGGSYHQMLRRYFEAAEVRPPRMHPMGTIEGVKRAVLAGGPVLGLLPEHAVDAELRAGTLAQVRVSTALRGLVLRAIRAPSAPRSSLVDELIEGLRGSIPLSPLLPAAPPRGSGRTSPRRGVRTRSRER